MRGFSAHASQTQLLDWVSHFSKPRPQLFLVHGEAMAKAVLRRKLIEAGWTAEVAGHAETFSF